VATDPPLSAAKDPPKYARIERERRFLLSELPKIDVVHVRQITDRYVIATTLRLRQQTDEDGSVLFKLTQKISQPCPGFEQGWITTMLVTEDEFHVLAELPSRLLRKRRHSVPPFGIDVFEGPLEGLVLAEAEFDSAAEAANLIIPPFLLHEVSTDPRFTGGELARASREEVRSWLAEFRIFMPDGGKPSPLP
jgi:CYTH domain-containing protein